ncbi:MAG: hypothetical protein HQK57_04675 [Deltaproteobacteria bacterium]|nr:hypothetical protein [Deltaproteobacteria bacterium]
MMATSPDDARGSDDRKENSWLEKRRSVLERLRREKTQARHNLAEINAARQRLRTEVDQLEAENHSLSRQVKELDGRLFELKQQTRQSYAQSDKLKANLVEIVAAERNLAEEIAFFESEKARLSQEHLAVSHQVGANMMVLDQTAKDIDFLNGEVEATIAKMNMAEGEVAVVYNGVSHLDDKITGMVTSLQDLSLRMKRMETHIKTVYYQMKKNAQESL